MCSDDAQALLEKFTQKTDLRSFCIATKTDDIYVNLHYLAELSEYFNVICTKEYSEKSDNKLSLSDVYAADLADFLGYVCPDKFTISRQITASNVCTLAYFSDRFMFPQVRADVKEWLATDKFFKDDLIPLATLVEIGIVLYEQGYSIAEMEPLFKKMGLFEEERVVELMKDTDQVVKEFLLSKIRIFRPYKFNSRPNSYFHLEDYRRRIFF
ncbi:unnamed protein product [Caenorhabditis bovis]|uniref:BTB domain-containing protein n=1 Tax=Caenorhabditis bovis TaxID=2654633 RepID=A0A8S1EJZ4_9PELO|nr:unnamed protein product [Caenorhabditis bovis]